MKYVITLKCNALFITVFIDNYGNEYDLCDYKNTNIVCFTHLGMSRRGPGEPGTCVCTANIVNQSAISVFLVYYQTVDVKFITIIILLYIFHTRNVKYLQSYPKTDTNFGCNDMYNKLSKSLFQH